MPERPNPASHAKFIYQSDQSAEVRSPETLRQENYGHLMIELQTEFREEHGIEGGFILGED